MRLAKLTVSGFKSFADRTEFTFGAPITGVVGPNGCGKSNIVDAVKWVLGERSAKSLRGKEMADVIFAGSAGRKPSGMASVTLTFENPELSRAELAARRAEGELSRVLLDEPAAQEDSGPIDAGVKADGRRWLPIDAETVDVERRLYRDGTSQYLINGSKARLKDIKELFLDTGVGAHAYSIIEQGKVDALLLANAVERRTFFEEAAGVARFKARRIEASRKLERAELSLTRVRDQLDSAERRLRIVRGQATKARRFQALDSRRRALRMALAFEQYEELSDRLAGLTSRLHDLEQDRARAIERVEELESAKQEAELQRHEMSGEREDAERTRAGAAHRGERARQRLEMTRSSMGEAERHLQQDEQRLASLGERAAALEGEAAEARDAIETLEEELASVERRVEQAAATRERAQEDLAERRHELATARASLSQIERDRTGAEAQVESHRERSRGLAEEAETLERRRDELAREKTESELRLASSAAEAERASRETARLEQGLEQMVASSTELSEEQRTAAGRLNELEQERARLDGRLATLREMAAAREGLGEATREALERRDASVEHERDDAFARIDGALAELIEVESRWAPAVESALGNALRGLVVPTWDDATRLAAEPELPGRVTVLATESVGFEASTVASGTAIDAVGARALSTLVQCDDRLRPLIDRLLGRTLVVEEPAAAARLASGRLAGRGYRFVTGDGVVVEADGRLIAGASSAAGEEGKGLLQRASEMHELETSVADLESALGAARQTLTSLDERARSLGSELADQRAAIAAEQRKHIAAEGVVERSRSERDRLEREVARVETDADRARRQAAERAERLAAEEQRLASLRTLIDEASSEVESLETAMERAGADAEAAGERVATLRVELGQRGERLGGARRELTRAEESLDEAKRERGRIAHAREQRLGQIEQFREVVGECDREIARAGDEEREAAERLERARAALVEVTEQTEALAADTTAARERASIVERDWSSLELSKRELEVRREHLEERATEEIGLDLAFEYPEYREMMAGGDVQRIDVEEVSGEIEELRAAIGKLGNVNLDAIGEEEQLEGRNEELARQVEDIDRAREQLESLIGRLNEASRDRFREVFETIQGHFSGKDGMFRRLFGGGRAELRLVPDAETGEIDWLESGIDVMAKPPGKEPRSISQLSGGEKTMTAVALLMSIFQSKPSPFCILDEVDAALDDANVERFCGIVRQFLDECHFIVITHNKRTMRSADLLYGVTMQERGVSKRVSVRFDDVGEDGRIRESKTKTTAPIADVSVRSVDVARAPEAVSVTDG